VWVSKPSLVVYVKHPNDPCLNVYLSPLMAAIFGRQPSAFDYLLNEVKMDVNVVEKSSNTTADVAAIMSSKWEPAITHCLCKLIACNAEMDCVDSHGATVWNYVPVSLREIVAEAFGKHKLNEAQSDLARVGTFHHSSGTFDGYCGRLLELCNHQLGAAPQTTGSVCAEWQTRWGLDRCGCVWV